MAENFFKRNPKAGALTRLIKRSELYKNGPHYLSATRKPAWAKLSATGGSCGKKSSIEISSGADNFQEKYMSGFKHDPTLESVNIRYGGDYGLNIELEVTIIAYNRSDFERIEEALLVPGSKVTLSFGYTGNIEAKAKEGYKISITEKGFRTTSFAVKTTENGGWICTSKASAPAQFIRTLETKIGLPTTLQGLKYVITGWLTNPDKGNVTGLLELMAYDAQSNGEQSIDKFEDGTVLQILPNSYAVIYDGDLAGMSWGLTKGIKKWWNAGDEADSKNSFNKVYFTLGYIIDRLVNQAILGAAKESAADDDQDDMAKLKVLIEPEQFSEIPNLISSGDPTRVLLLGEGFAKFQAQGEETRDFYELVDDKPAVKCAEWSAKASKIKHSKILIAKGEIEDAITDSTIEKAKESNPSNTNVKKTDTKEIQLETFLNKIFGLIKEVTGGAVNLGLTVDDNDPEKNTLRVVDRNYGKANSLQLITLNPIDGDGTTRTCEVTSNVGSNEYQAYMFTGGSGEKDAVTHLRKCEGPDNSKEKLKAYQKASADIEELAGLNGGKGTVLKSKFSPAQTESLIGAFKVIYNNIDAISDDHKKEFRMMPYMGVELSATLDGIWGIIPGNAFTTTQLPTKYRLNGGYFMIRSVEHSIQNSDWTTSISGILTYHTGFQVKTL